MKVMMLHWRCSTAIVIAALWLSPLSVAPGRSQARPFRLEEATITDIQDGYKSGQLNAHQLVQMYLDRINEFDKKGPKLNSIISVNPKALDKVARAHAVTHLLTDGVVYLPRVRGNPDELRWVADYLLHMGAFPRGRHDDWADSTTQALNWLRQSGILVRREEQRTIEVEERQYRKPDAPLYPV